MIIYVVLNGSPAVTDHKKHTLKANTSVASNFMRAKFGIQPRGGEKVGRKTGGSANRCQSCSGSSERSFSPRPEQDVIVID
jgi:hypothetical protein